MSYYKNIFLGMTRSFGLTYINDYREKDSRYGGNSPWNNTKQLGFYYELIKPFRLGRRLTFKPSLKVTETFKTIENLSDENSSNKLSDTFITSFKSSLNLRFRVATYMDWNLHYFMVTQKKLDPIINLVTFSNNMYFGDKIQVKNWVSYNSKTNNESFEKYKNRFTPVNTEVMWIPGCYITAYIQQSQLLNPIKFKSCKVDLIVRPTEKIHFSFGSFYQNCDDLNMPYTDNHKIKNILGVWWWITPKWELYYNVKTTSCVNLSHRKIDEYEFKLFRNLHCYILGIIWKLKNGESDVYFKFDIKTNMPLSKIKEISD
jgi:hypothetical protein